LAVECLGVDSVKAALAWSKFVQKKGLRRPELTI
jgi:hypothetical protein